MQDLLYIKDFIRYLDRDIAIEIKEHGNTCVLFSGTVATLTWATMYHSYQVYKLCCKHGKIMFTIPFGKQTYVKPENCTKDAIKFMHLADVLPLYSLMRIDKFRSIDFCISYVYEWWDGCKFANCDLVGIQPGVSDTIHFVVKKEN